MDSESRSTTYGDVRVLGKDAWAWPLRRWEVRMSGLGGHCAQGRAQRSLVLNKTGLAAGLETVQDSFITRPRSGVYLGRGRVPWSILGRIILLH